MAGGTQRDMAGSCCGLMLSVTVTKLNLTGNTKYIITRYMQNLAPLGDLLAP